jgi:hypothetical protein
MKVELILPCMWAHLKNETCEISLGKRHAHRNHAGLGTWAVVPARQLLNVGIELLYTLHKLTNVDPLGLLEHVPDVVLLLLSHVIGEHSEKVEHHAVIKRLNSFTSKPVLYAAYKCTIQTYFWCA